MNRWTADPVAFSRDCLGVDPWSKQIELLRAVADPAAVRVAVRSGHKVSKSNSAALLAIWWTLLHPGGRCILIAPTGRQIKEIVWRELRRRKMEAPYPIGGELARDPGTGWSFPGGAQIIGLSTDEPERLGGFSGEHLLFIVDEGSGVEDWAYEALEGNMAGGAKLLLLGNPTRTTGQFHRCFHSERHLWTCLHISSTDSPNVTGERHIPGLATPGWVEDMRIKWAAEPDLFRVRVLGEFPESDEHGIIPLAWIEEAVQRWREMERAGTLPEPDALALDVATGVGRDAGVIAEGCGPVVTSLWSSTEADTMQQTGRVFRAWQRGYRVTVDADGAGVGVVHRLRELGAEVDAFQGGEGADGLVDVSGELAFRNRVSWAWWRVREMLDPTTGSEVALPPDAGLLEDLASVRYRELSDGTIQRETKDAIKKRLGRSPDKGDAVVMLLAGGKDRSMSWVDGMERAFRLQDRSEGIVETW